MGDTLRSRAYSIIRYLIIGYHCEASHHICNSSLEATELVKVNQTQLHPSSGTATGSWVWSDGQQSSHPSESHPPILRCRQSMEASKAYETVSDNTS
jgi:hypothetical protein